MGILDGKIAVVTGASRGIGRAIATAFLDEGARVAFNGREQSSANDFIGSVDVAADVWFCQGSVLNTADIEALIDGAVDHFGHIDILVNNAGGSAALKPVAELDEAAWEEDLRWNLTSTFLATKIALKHMLAQQSGTVINISSVEGKIGTPSMAAYVAAKHGVNGLTKSVAAEVGRQGITVNALCPGLILTDAVTTGGPGLAESLGMTFDELVDNVFKAKTLTGELNTAEQVAAMCVFLASPAGRGITGSQISIDGGTAPY